MTTLNHYIADNKKRFQVQVRKFPQSNRKKLKKVAEQNFEVENEDKCILYEDVSYDPQPCDLWRQVAKSQVNIWFKFE